MPGGRSAESSPAGAGAVLGQAWVRRVDEDNGTGGLSEAGKATDEVEVTWVHTRALMLTLSSSARRRLRLSPDR